MDHDNMGNVTSAHADVGDTSVVQGGSYDVDVTAIYDEVGRPVSKTLLTGEPMTGSLSTQQLERTWSYSYYDASGVFTQTGPDGQTTTVETDFAGRVTSLIRGGLSAEATYYANGLVQTVTYGNGAVVEYEYDDAERLSVIRHKESSGGATILQMEYTYNPRGLITRIDETEPGGTASVTYGYDQRGRLIEEHREGTHPYWLAYTYDVGDNRQTKVQFDPNSQSQAYGATILRTDYHYDTDDELVDCNGDGIPDTLAAECYQTRNNRLMAYDVFDAEDNLIERVDYRYENLGVAAGNPVEIVRRLPTDIWTPTTGITLQYDNKGELSFAVTQIWWEGYCETNYLSRIDEFRGDGRARTMRRQRKTDGYPEQIKPGSTEWFDYSDDWAYSDYDASIDSQSPYDLTLTEKTKHVPGIGEYDVANSAARYQHGDRVGSLRAVSDGSADVTGRVVYTAFGERVWSDGQVGTRHQYCGAWGYETESADDNDWIAALPFTHVGHRWYSPSTGRFLQRDPIGINGGLNVYEYCDSSPLIDIDPDGLIRWIVHEDNMIGHEAIILQVGKNWFVRVDFGSYGLPGSGDNINVSGGPNLRSLLRPKDIIKGARNTTIDHDVSTLRKAIHKYNDKRYWLAGRNCRNVARKLFSDNPPFLPGRKRY